MITLQLALMSGARARVRFILTDLNALRALLEEHHTPGAGIVVHIQSTAIDQSMDKSHKVADSPLAACQEVERRAQTDETIVRVDAQLFTPFAIWTIED